MANSQNFEPIALSQAWEWYENESFGMDFTFCQ
jgi:hypothetical protein